MKKALQIPHLRARNTVSDRTVVPTPCERGRGSPRDRLPELLVLDGRGPFGGLPALLQGSRGRLRNRLLGRPRLGQRTRQELERRAARQAGRDLGRAVPELEGPDRVLRVDDERAVALEAGRPGVAGDLR